MKCGHCGTVVEEGYHVCSSCGANFRGHNGRKTIGILLISFGVIMIFAGFNVANGLKDFLFAIIFSTLFVLPGFYIFKWGNKKQWWRSNN